MSVLAVIPARFGSSRYPGKPLLKATGKFLIQHVVDQVRQARHVQEVIVATDDQRIVRAVESFGGRAVLTATTHCSGTDRVAEVAQRPEFAHYQYFLNVQGDEPEIPPETIDDLARLIAASAVSEKGAVSVAPREMVTAAVSITDSAAIANPNVVKVVVDATGRALYFSRSVIPYCRTDGGLSRAGGPHLIYRQHLGVYAYRRDFLLRLAAHPPCILEEYEKLEQLRALFMGATILVHDVPLAPHGIDTPADYETFIQRYASQNR